MTEVRLGIVMNGVTGRMGTNQHLIRSILKIMEQGGVELDDGTRVMPDPILVGRNRSKVETLAHAHGVERWTTDLDAAIADPADELFFDAASTHLRAGLLKQAIKAGKHVYCEKPLTHTVQEVSDRQHNMMSLWGQNFTTRDCSPVCTIRVDMIEFGCEVTQRD